MAEGANGQKGEGGQAQGGGVATAEKSEGGSSTRSRVITAAALSVAAGTSFVAARRALSQRGGNGQGQQAGSGGDGTEARSDGGGPTGQAAAARESLRSAAEAVSWDRLKDILMPFAENAASAAGEYTAKQGPELLTDRLLPRFIESFNEARGKS